MDENPYDPPKTQHNVEQPRWSLRRVLILVLGCFILVPIFAYLGLAAGALTAMAIVPPEQRPEAESIFIGFMGGGASVFALIAVILILHLSRKYAHAAK